MAALAAGSVLAARARESAALLADELLLASGITAVVYDERYNDCRAFANVLARRGSLAFPVRGDAAAVWYRELREHIARRGGSVAGMTTDCDWVVSRGCGRELSCKVVYEGSHDWRTQGRLEHQLRGSAREIYASLLRADIPWTKSIANGLLGISGNGRLRAPSVFAERAVVTAPLSSDQPGYLSSWMLSSS